MSQSVFVAKRFDRLGVAAPTWLVYREGVSGQRVTLGVWSSEEQALEHARILEVLGDAAETMTLAAARVAAMEHPVNREERA